MLGLSLSSSLWSRSQYPAISVLSCILTPRMAESHHSLLPSQEDTISHFPPSGDERSSEDVTRGVGLAITDPAGVDNPRESRSSTSSPRPVSGFFPIPHETPTLSTSHPPGNCPTRSAILQRRLSWVPATVLVLSLYATLFSGLYLAVAIWKPRWNILNHSDRVGSSTAQLLCAFIAKTIELSYVTICVAFLGQVLSRRALVRGSRGISLSDVTMRAWITQPGSMIVHWETLRYSGLTFLGTIALIATFVAMLYTTATQALGEFSFHHNNERLFIVLLVSPKLSMGPVESTTLSGKVFASFSNSKYLARRCQTPIPESMDPIALNTTCLQMEHVGQAYHDYQQWITTWSNLVISENSLADLLRLRPKPSGSISDNTTVSGSWIEVQNITELSAKHGRMMNNITMAMPHGGIPSAAMDPANNIRQPQDTSGEGKYTLEASVPSPAINVLCVGLNESELRPMVYSQWPNADFNPTSWNANPPKDIPAFPSWLNKTVVDDIFGFGEKYGQRPPVFGTIPGLNNTLANTTGVWPANAIYILGKPSVSYPEYVMCSLRVKQTGLCSTRYEVETSGARLISNCEDPTNKLQYDRRYSGVIEGLWSPEWKNIATEWANSLSLGTGITNSQASNTRLLMQMMPDYDPDTNTYSVNPALPTVGEALAVMAGSTLILGSKYAPFVPYWNYSVPGEMLVEPTYQTFDATLQAVGYASGGRELYQNVFYIILAFAFATSALCFTFMVIEARGRLITDFTETQNLFALAVNSPPSAQLNGACGSGPVGRQLKERWFIGMDEGDAHYYIQAKKDETNSSARQTAYNRLESMEIEDKPASPAVNEFRRVSKRWSFLAKFY